ncbi:cephalosporin hydroxylase family protein [Pollutimonas sp. M17]|uniref:cephalosporin hydroxylase family protein n=1 Tax=Pollutimonas sp. M17 TaxID=2962065 RepID=UPI0021F4CE77|nr:cephalosporin hydroxylase family protein [Pollutimonas sp. M17]UYO94997.1 cephalosporin hydroxylase family protein [Pollutimonas sp. M17]
MRYLNTTPDAATDYQVEKRERIIKYGQDAELKALSIAWRDKIIERKYMYNASWLGRPIIQLPTDTLALQEIIWAVKPDLIIETGVAHGGSIIFSASMLQLLGHGHVVGIDIDIRPHNRAAIETHPMAHRISLIEGSSVDADIVKKVHDMAAGKKVLVMLDSNHAHDHVLAELNAYASLVSVGSYCIVFDTVVEDYPDESMWSDRPWKKGDNPKTAVHEWLGSHPEFEIDQTIQEQILVTAAPDGFLLRVK